MMHLTHFYTQRPFKFFPPTVLLAEAHCTTALLVLYEYGTGNLTASTQYSYSKALQSVLRPKFRAALNLLSAYFSIFAAYSAQPRAWCTVNSTRNNNNSIRT